MSAATATGGVLGTTSSAGGTRSPADDSMLDQTLAWACELDARFAVGLPGAIVGVASLQPGELCEQDGGGGGHQGERGPSHDGREFAVAVFPHECAVGSDQHHQEEA